MLALFVFCLLVAHSIGNLLDQQAAAAVNSLLGDDSSVSSYKNPNAGSSFGYPRPSIPSAYAVPYVSSGSSWPYYNNPYDNNNWNYGMPTPTLNQPNVNNTNCYYFFNTGMVYDFSTNGERIAAQWEQNMMNACLTNPYYVPCLCPSCSAYQ